MTDIAALIAALKDYRQADDDGVMVLVSRQACEEAAAALEEQQAEIDDIKQVQFPKKIDATCAAWRQRAERAEAERDALRQDAERISKLLLKWLRITNYAKHSGASVADWDQLRQDSDAAMKESAK